MKLHNSIKISVKAFKMFNELIFLIFCKTRGNI